MPYLPPHTRCRSRRRRDGRNHARPWGLVFIQSYAADKHLTSKDLRYENVDVIVGATLTGVIALFVVVACAATLHVKGIETDDAKDAAKALEPLAGATASTLFGIGFLGAAPARGGRGPAVDRLFGRRDGGKPADVDDSFQQALLFYLSYGGALAIAAGLVLIPGASLIQILFLSQALNAVLLLVMLPVMRSLASDTAVMGEEALGRPGRIVTAVFLALIAASVLTLGVLTVTA